MKSNLYIPKTIKIGFQKRDDTFTGKLAYVIYTDDKGVLRKEKSWQSWCDAKIKALDFDNEPVDGFMINKDVQRYNWSHFSSNRSYIRIHDPRGFEFEISPENLIGILMSGNCDRRVLQGKFVYSWSGIDLVLLPESSENYSESRDFTKLQAKKISVKDLKPGFVYRSKKMEDLVFLGRFTSYEEKYKRDEDSEYRKERVGKKSFIWSTLEKQPVHSEKNKKDNYYLSYTAGIAHLAECVSEVPNINYPFMMDTWNSSRLSKNIERLDFEPEERGKFGKKYDRYNKIYNKNEYVVEFLSLDTRPGVAPGTYLEYYFEMADSTRYVTNSIKLYSIKDVYSFGIVCGSVNKGIIASNQHIYYHGKKKDIPSIPSDLLPPSKEMTLDELFNHYKPVNCFVVYEDGVKEQYHI